MSTCLTLICLNQLAGERVQDDRAQVGLIVEVEHVENGAGDPVEGPLALGRAGRMVEIVDTSEVPVILDKPQDRGLVGRRAIDKVGLGPGRDGQQRQARGRGVKSC